MFRYRLYSRDGDEIGEATYAMMIQPGEQIHLNGGRLVRVMAVMPFEEADASPFVGIIEVEAG